MIFKIALEKLNLLLEAGSKIDAYRYYDGLNASEDKVIDRIEEGYKKDLERLLGKYNHVWIDEVIGQDNHIDIWMGARNSGMPDPWNMKEAKQILEKVQKIMSNFVKDKKWQIDLLKQLNSAATRRNDPSVSISKIELKQEGNGLVDHGGEGNDVGIQYNAAIKIYLEGKQQELF